jgi:hypothetical protein
MPNKLICDDVKPDDLATSMGDSRVTMVRFVNRTADVTKPQATNEASLTENSEVTVATLKGGIRELISECHTMCRAQCVAVGCFGALNARPEEPPRHENKNAMP